MFLVEIMVPLGRLTLASKITNSQNQVHDVEAIEEKRQNAKTDGWFTEK